MSNGSHSSALHEALGDRDMLRAAVETFGDKGVRGTRVEDLLRSAGIARRTFYKRFRGKDDVLAKLYVFVTRALMERIDEAQAEAADPLTGLTAALDAYLDFHLRNDAIARVLIEEAVRTDSALHPLRSRFRRQLVRAMDDAYRQLTGAALHHNVFLALISGLEGLSLELLAGPRTEADVARVRATILGMVASLTRSPELLPRA